MRRTIVMLSKQGHLYMRKNIHPLAKERLTFFRENHSSSSYQHPTLMSRHKPVVPETSKELQQSIKNQTHVSTKLATHLLSNKHSNVVFSPLSIHVVLSVLAAGSKGQTLDETLAFLKENSTDDLNSLYSQLAPFIFTDGSPNGGPCLSFANGVWVDKTTPLKPSFKEVVDIVYQAACKQVDFKNKADEAVDEVNLWAERQTNGLIKQVIRADAIDDLTRLIFTNAIYFKGTWSEQFNESRTKKSNFYLLDGNKVRVPFMTSNDKQFVRKYDAFKVLGLPYKQGKNKRQFTMYFFLPDAHDGLQSLVEKIGCTSEFLDRHIPRRRVDVGKFLIPKFKLSFEFEAKDMLQELGLVTPFVYGEAVTEMVESPYGLYVSGIYHKSFVEVNEEGTEAAAVSALIMGLGCASPMVPEPIPIDFVADHPFLFVIREDVTGVVLFMGKVVNPSCAD